MSIQPAGEAIRWVQNRYLAALKSVKDEDPKEGVITKALGNIERCVRGYSKREGFCGKLSGIIYSIWNTIKAIFGQSDWQVARRALKDLMINFPKSEAGDLVLLTLLAQGDKLNKDIILKQNSTNTKISNLGSVINNKDLDIILNQFIAIGQNNSLRQFLAVPGIKTLMSNKTIPSKEMMKILLAVAQELHFMKGGNWGVIMNIPIMLRKLREALPEQNQQFEYLQKPLEDYWRQDVVINKEPISDAEKQTQKEDYIRSIPELAEFIPLLEVSTDDLYIIYPDILESISTIYTTKYQPEPK